MSVQVNTELHNLRLPLIIVDYLPPCSFCFLSFALRKPTDQINGSINLNFKIKHDVVNVRKESLLLDEAIKVCQFKASGLVLSNFEILSLETIIQGMSRTPNRSS